MGCDTMDCCDLLMIPYQCDFKALIEGEVHGEVHDFTPSSSFS